LPLSIGREVAVDVSLLPILKGLISSTVEPEEIGGANGLLGNGVDIVPEN